MEGIGLKYLLDTAPWINAVTMPRVIPARVLSLMRQERTTALCSISLLEAAILHRLGRLQIRAALEEFFATGLADNIALLELTPAIAVKSNQLATGFQGDPFDRTIVATAAVLNLTLITADPAIRDAKECFVEYYPFRPSRL